MISAINVPSTVSITVLAAIPNQLSQLHNWLAAHADSLWTSANHGPIILAWLVGSCMFWVAINGYRRKRRHEHNRRHLPLCIGGLGNRGKSSTERLKVGLFHGLGFAVVAKTSGRNAAWLHAVPGQRSDELVLYETGDTVWEPDELLDTASALQPEVFVRECAPGRPYGVDTVPQPSWADDDLVTISDVCADREYIPGLTGCDAAQATARSIPAKATAITTEVSFLPILADACRARGSDLVAVHERSAQLLSSDLLDLFPHQEHAHNIALAASVGAQFGVDLDLAVVTMADHVVPDQSALKSYPRVQLRGRYLTFINAMGASEPHSVLASWQRVGLGDVEQTGQPERVIVTVVNSCDGRLAHTHGLAPILLRDIVADRHVLIGTDRKRLRRYLDKALNTLLSEQAVLTTEEWDAPAAAGSNRGRYQAMPVPLTRLAAHMDRLRIPVPTVDNVLARWRIYARGAGLAVEGGLAKSLARPLSLLLRTEPTDPVGLSQVQSELAADPVFADVVAIVRALPQDATEDLDAPELLLCPQAEEVVAHLRAELARIIVRARLEARLKAIMAGGNRAAVRGFQHGFRAAYRELFAAQVQVIDDSAISGDQIIDAVARMVPPGAEVSGFLFGCHNPTGPGMDLVARWGAVERVHRALQQLASPVSEQRLAALRALDDMPEPGLLDAGLARTALNYHHDGDAALIATISAEEERLLARARHRCERAYQHRRAALTRAGKPAAIGTAISRLGYWLTGWLDSIADVARHRRSRQIIADIAHGRISRGRAAVELRALAAPRQRGHSG